MLRRGRQSPLGDAASPVLVLTLASKVLLAKGVTSLPLDLTTVKVFSAVSSAEAPVVSTGEQAGSTQPAGHQEANALTPR